MKIIRVGLLVIVALFVVGMGTVVAETIVLDPNDYIENASIHALPGQSFAVTNFGGIHGLDATVSLVEFTNAQKVVQAGGNNGFFCRLLGTGSGSGSLAAVTLKIDFTTTGDEAVQSVRVSSISSIDTDEAVGLSSSQAGITCTGRSSDGGVVVGNDTTNVTVGGDADDAAYVLETAGGTRASPIQSVDFRYFSDSRPGANIDHEWRIEVVTVPRVRTFVFDPQDYIGNTEMNALSGQSFSVTNFGSIPDLIVDCSLVEFTNALKVVQSGGSDGFFSRLAGTNQVLEGDSLSAVALQFDFTAMGTEVVESIRVESVDAIVDYEAVGLISSQSGITCTGTSTNGGVILGAGTANAQISGDANGASYLLETVGGSLTNPLDTVTFRYLSDPRPAANPVHQWRVTISTVSEYELVDPQDYIGTAAIQNLPGQSFAVTNLVGISNLNMNVSLVEFIHVEKVVQSAATDGFFCRLLGTDDAPGGDLAAMGLRFEFSTNGAEVVESFRVQNMNNSGLNSLMSDENIGLISSQSGITCAGTAYFGAALTGSGTTNITVQGDADGAGYVLKTVGGSFANPIESVDMRYFSDSRSADNVAHQWGVLIKTTAGSERIAIIGVKWVAPGVLELEINAPSPAGSHLRGKTDLVSGSWADAPHADNSSGPFVVSNLSYSAASGTNVLIYVEADQTAEFFSVDIP